MGKPISKAVRRDLRSLDEVAALTGVARRTLQDWLHHGDLTAWHIRGDRKRYIDVADVNRLRTPVTVRRTGSK